MPRAADLRLPTFEEIVADMNETDRRDWTIACRAAARFKRRTHRVNTLDDYLDVKQEAYLIMRQRRDKLNRYYEQFQITDRDHQNAIAVVVVYHGLLNKLYKRRGFVNCDHRNRLVDDPINEEFIGYYTCAEEMIKIGDAFEAALLCIKGERERDYILLRFSDGVQWREAELRSGVEGNRAIRCFKLFRRKFKEEYIMREGDAEELFNCTSQGKWRATLSDDDAIFNHLDES